ncbi:MAG: alkaline phosphatase [Chitinophagales bacterium]|nr:MAG: alkaline phosphatase [Chitinophagales bacterium]
MKCTHLLITFLFLISCNNSRPVDTTNVPQASSVPRVKNVILMVGDGMGIAQITAALYANGNRLALEKMQQVGLIKTHSADKLITDSAAGATAFSTGRKTFNGAIGLDKDSLPQETVLETCKKNGMSTGIVVTSSITHATPAAFYAHVLSRKLMDDIALNFVKNPVVDFFVGGGRKYFTQRQDNINLLDSLKAIGYKFYPLDSLHAVSTLKAGVFTAEEEPASLLRGRTPYLPDAVSTALNVLSKQDKGFFLLVEGSQIDWGGHAEDSDYIIEEILEFNRAVEEVLRFAEKDKHTLVVVTADHETGGYTITDGTLDGSSVKGEFVNNYHSAEMVPVFAFGPRAESFAGIYENTAIYDKLMAALGLQRSAL